MPAGLQIFDAAGNILLDTNTSICRVYGTVQVSGTGSVSVPDGRPWYSILEKNSFGFEECAYQFTIGSNSISWTPYPSEPFSPAPDDPLIVYGAY
jgi:hypothetical protein